MSRVGHSLRYATAAVGIALALAGCGAGQISQTAGMEPAVNGGEGDVGPIAVRDIQLAYPPHGVYEPGSAAVVLGTLVNSGQTDDALVSITTPAGQVTITGDKNLPAGRSLIFETPVGGVPTSTSSSSSSSVPATTGSQTSGSQTSGSQTSGSQTSGSRTSGSQTSGAATTTTTPPPTTTSRPVTIGKVTVILTGISEEIRSGKTIELTFTFRNGSVTIPVPIAVPTTPRQPAAGGGGGH
ncbi:hypothetical protein LWC34_41180 [Kibdelosporangium philippinense]|uniref:Copper(I)-binding protein n=1 Tax=Kibdelosporangium philippinense TaxID=211113 RepID=A0ABS8ZN74_9PSEU|nr:hypothetical protein [Kibdelosporangium philippinense]MCE7009184.1 hypothetical protein [Kibdelosporangium philippinense]